MLSASLNATVFFHSTNDMHDTLLDGDQDSNPSSNGRYMIYRRQSRRLRPVVRLPAIRAWGWQPPIWPTAARKCHQWLTPLCQSCWNERETVPLACRDVVSRTHCAQIEVLVLHVLVANNNVIVSFPKNSTKTEFQKVPPGGDEKSECLFSTSWARRGSKSTTCDLAGRCLGASPGRRRDAAASSICWGAGGDEKEPQVTQSGTNGVRTSLVTLWELTCLFLGLLKF